MLHAMDQIRLFDERMKSGIGDIQLYKRACYRGNLGSQLKRKARSGGRGCQLKIECFLCNLYLHWFASKSGSAGSNCPAAARFQDRR